MKSLSIPVLIILGMVLSIITLSGQEAEVKIKFLPPEEFIARYNLEDSALFIDARPASMHRKSRIEGTINVANIENLEAMSDTIDIETPVYIHCSTQGRATATAEALKERGFTNLTVMDGGMIAWRARELPIDKKRIKKKRDK